MFSQARFFLLLLHFPCPNRSLYQSSHISFSHAMKENKDQLNGFCFILQKFLCWGIRHPLRIQWNVRACNSNSVYRLRHTRLTRQKTADSPIQTWYLIPNGAMSDKIFETGSFLVTGRGSLVVVRVIGSKKSIWFLRNFDLIDQEILKRFFCRIEITAYLVVLLSFQPFFPSTLSPNKKELSNESLFALCRHFNGGIINLVLQSVLATNSIRVPSC